MPITGPAVPDPVEPTPPPESGGTGGPRPLFPAPAGPLGPPPTPSGPTAPVTEPGIDIMTRHAPGSPSRASCPPRPPRPPRPPPPPPHPHPRRPGPGRFGGAAPAAGADRAAPLAAPVGPRPAATEAPHPGAGPLAGRSGPRVVPRQSILIRNFKFEISNPRPAGPGPAASTPSAVSGRRPGFVKTLLTRPGRRARMRGDVTRARVRPGSGPISHPRDGRWRRCQGPTVHAEATGVDSSRRPRRRGPPWRRPTRCWPRPAAAVAGPRP